MLNYKLEKDYLYSDGYYRQKSVGDAVNVVDKLLVQLINEWNTVRRDTSLQEDDIMHEKIDALRDCLYYLTNKDEYNNDIEVRQRLHENYHFWEKYGATTDEEFDKIRLEEKEKGEPKIEKKLHKKKLQIRRAGRVIIKERLYGMWAVPYLKGSTFEQFRSRA
ncbi:hypothetical protein [Bacillus mycoides]|uniref:Uncharacterized protein n=1 Tax=Bacillus mycoides TaxID=1405 RepID=A0ABX6Z976_BACMY|nr:hypothetical protein [Bacillus mycoides]AJH22201.1 putative nADH dehydrogenase subunit 2 [Bacillus mycoides]EEL96112.1 NADH dehydrogenase subunit 2 [Bacillus mycoides DSM 2048]MDR4240297.1 hypothetical protein [Bacillus mycoides]MED1426490.1 hypothetical protein [Bacillus mycoides]MED1487541.1 hypothetical protein [Bacillus mycoides]